MASLLTAPRLPGVYLEDVEAAAPDALPRLDVAAFVGFAERGPVDVPVRVEDPAEFRRVFGTDRVLVDRAGERIRPMLARAVESFFENGGRRCWVVRVMGEGGVRAELTVPGLRYRSGERATVRASSPGAWGNRLRIATRMVIRPMNRDGVEWADGPERFLVPSGDGWAVGDLLRIRDRLRRVFLFEVERLEPESGDAGGRLRATGHLTDVGPVTPISVGPARSVKEVSFDLTVEAGELGEERIRDLGFVPGGARFWMDVVRRESAWLDPPVAGPGEVEPRSTKPIRMSRAERTLLFVGPRPAQQGADDFEGFSPEPFVPDAFRGMSAMAVEDLLLRAQEERHRAGLGRVPTEPVRLRGMLSLLPIEEIGTIALPDALQVPGEPLELDTTVPPPLPPPPPPAPERGVFAPCATPDAPPPAPVPEPEPLRAPPRAVSSGFSPDAARSIQRAAIRLCALRRDRVAVLGVPRGADPLEWRATLPEADLDLSYAALYHPWLRVRDPRPVDRGALRIVPPDGAACGAIAKRELARRAVWIAPANDPLRGVLALAEQQTTEEWRELLGAGVNLIRRTPEDFRILSARTLSDDRELSQLNVRRLMILLRKLLLRWGQDFVFEPNSPGFRAQVQRRIEEELERLFRAGAFAGSTAAEAYRVVTDATVNPPASIDAGRLVALVKVSPSWPMEYLEVRLIRTGEGVLQLSEA